MSDGLLDDILRLPELHHTADAFAFAGSLLLIRLHRAWGSILDGKLAPLAMRTAYETGQTSDAGPLACRRRRGQGGGALAVAELGAVRHWENSAVSSHGRIAASEGRDIIDRHS